MPETVEVDYNPFGEAETDVRLELELSVDAGSNVKKEAESFIPETVEVDYDPFKPELSGFEVDKRGSVFEEEIPTSFSPFGAALYEADDEGDVDERIMKATMDAGMFNIPRSLAMEMAGSIESAMHNNKDTAERRAGIWEKTKQSYKIGRDTTARNMLAQDFIKTGNVKSIEDALAIKLPEREELFTPSGIFQEMIMSTSELISMPIQAAKDGSYAAGVLGAGFGAVALAAGQPELVIPAIAGGIKVGMTAGGLKSIWEQEAGGLVLELFEMEDKEGNKLDPAVIRGTAAIGGAAVTALEATGMKLLIKTIPGGKRLFSNAIAKTLKSPTVKQKLFALALEGTATVEKETGIEFVQEVTNIVSSEIAKVINNSFRGTEFERVKVNEAIDRLSLTIRKSALGFPGMILPGTVLQAGGVVADARARTKAVDAQTEEQRVRIHDENVQAVTESLIVDEEMTPEEAEVEAVKRVDATERIQQTFEQADAADFTEVDAVIEDVAFQLAETGKFTEEEALVQAEALYGGFFRQMERREGVKATELYTRYNLDIAVGDDKFDADLDRLRADKKPTPKQAYGMSALEFIADRGGVTDIGGELAALGIQEWHKGKPFQGRVVQEGGISLDEMGEALHEAGYFVERPDINEVLDVIDAEMRGAPSFSEANFTGQADTLFELERLEDTLNGMDLDVTKLDNAAIRARIRAEARGVVGEEVDTFEQAAPVESPEFKAWFGESKVVDEQGEPLVVYHGTAVDIDQFAIPEDRKAVVDLYGKGFYFTDEAELASTFARRSIIAGKGRQANVLPVYLDMKNPFITTEKESYKALADYREGSNVLTEKLTKAGYDGLIIKERTEGGYAGLEEVYKGFTEYVAFEPTQIKSVFAQKFDPADPRILEQGKPGESRARISFAEGDTFIELLKRADKSSFIHETGHFFLKAMTDLSLKEGASKKIVQDIQTIRDWVGAKEGKALTVAQEEKFARGFEQYLRKGKAPTKALQKAFIEFRAWLIQVYKSLKSLDVELTPEVEDVMNRMIASERDMKVMEAEQAAIDKTVEGKKVVARAEVTATLKTIAEETSLSSSWSEAMKGARNAFKAGKDVEAEVWKAKMQKVMDKANRKIVKLEAEKKVTNRRRLDIRAISEILNLTGAQTKKLLGRKDFRLMNDAQFLAYRDDLVFRAVQMQENAQSKAKLHKVLLDKQLHKWENYQKAMGLPSIANMTTKQLDDFATLMAEFEVGDVFLGKRAIETVDKTDLKGVRTWREARERLSEESGISMEELQAIKVEWTDKFLWDSALAEKNPFYEVMVGEINRNLLKAEMRAHEVENKVYELAKAAAKSRKKTVKEKAVGWLIPQEPLIIQYLETPIKDRELVAKNMTPEEVDLAVYMQDYFAQALEYLIETKSLEKGRSDYFVHIRRHFLETAKDDGIVTALKESFKGYEQDVMGFGILDEQTGNILPLNKFFQYSMRRTGELVPSQNVVRSFLIYVKTFERKVELDATMPKLDIYVQSLTPRHYTKTGLEVDTSLKDFVYKYINNKKGRRVDMAFVKQGDKIDLSVKALRTFTSILDLGFNIYTGAAATVGEQAANFALLGEKAYARGTARMATKQGRAIIKEHEAFVGRSLWEEFKAPGKVVTERVMEGMFGLFHEATVIANSQYLLASLTKEEFESGVLSTERLAEMRLEMGRMRVVPGSKSLIGSTGIGGAVMQYKGWAAPLARTTIKDAQTLVSDLRSKGVGEALSTREAKELFRIIRLTAAVVIVSSIMADDEEDKSFVGKLIVKIKRETLSAVGAIDPTLWASVPRSALFLEDLLANLKSLVLLEEYKTKPGLKGAARLKRQFTPSVVRQLTPEEDKNVRRVQ